MKELTKEQKAKAYDEAIKRARNHHDNDGLTLEQYETIDIIFPELKESEGERIRKAIICGMYALKEQHKTCFASIPIENAIAWLEKQVEFYTKRDVDNAYIEGMAFAKDELEKQADQNPVEMVTPKLKVGDWCIDNEDDTIFQIVKVLDNTYTYKTIGGKEYSCSHYSLENDAHLWKIQDAKDGDVLNSPTHHLIWIHKDIQHYHACVNMNYVKENFFLDGFIVIPTDVCPATKDEQTILFARMKEEGYEWDAEKKESKKIEQEPTDNDIKEALRTEYEKGRADAIAEMQKPTWCEDDEKIGKELIGFCIKCSQGNTVASSQDDFTRWATWLKSLKERYTWKPSEKQIEALKNAIHIKPYENPSDSLLWGLYEQLKKLK